MPALFDCPELDCWQALFDDAVAPSQREAYEHHLESCRACQQRIHRAEDDRDELVTMVRRLADAATEPHDPSLDSFLERLRGVKSPLHPPEGADLTFLRRAHRPGLLGILGAYEVLEVIGQGGMGIVLKAFEPALQRLVAVKVMAPCLASSANARRRFTREARSAAAISHDHVVKVHEVLEEAGLPYLVMEYVAGESLQSRIDRNGQLEVAEIVGIGLQTALGLAGAHAQGLIHRDVKPANILLSCGGDPPDGTDGTDGTERTDVSHPSSPSYRSHKFVVKITDFGLARMVDDVHLTQHGVVAGTPEYMAPEQARGESVDHRADLFSLGSVLYALCTGVPPFRGSSALAVLRQVSDDEPEAIHVLNPKVPEWLEKLILRLMAKDPADRFQSAAEVAALLEGYQAQVRGTALVRASEHPSPLADDCLGVPESGLRVRIAKHLPQRRWLTGGFMILAVLAFVSASLWFRGLLFSAAMQEDLVAPPGRAVGDGKKENPAADAKKPSAPVQGPAPPKALPPTPEQERAIAILRRLNAKFKFDAPGRPIVHVSIEPGTDVDDILEALLPLTEIGVLGLQGTKITDAGLKHVAGFVKLHQLYLGQTAITDAGLKELATLEELTHLGLENTRVSDAGIKSIVNLKTLRYLNIGSTAVTDRCLKDIGGLPQLGMLCLYSTEVTDAGMKELAGLTSLRTLLLNNTELTDAGIKALAPLKQLKKIDVQNTKVTDAGLKALREAVPAAEVEVDPGAELRGQTGRPRGWLMAAGVVTGLIVLTAAGIVLVVRKKQNGARTPLSLEQLHKKTSSSAALLSITLQCPSCQRKLQAKAELAGKAVKCPSCGSAVLVPSLQVGLPPAESARPNG